jgi:hypothetical protein
MEKWGGGGMDHLEDRYRWNDNIKIEIKEILCKSTNANKVIAQTLRLCLAALHRICS